MKNLGKQITSILIDMEVCRSSEPKKWRDSNLNYWRDKLLSLLKAGGGKNER